MSLKRFSIRSKRRESIQNTTLTDINKTLVSNVPASRSASLPNGILNDIVTNALEFNERSVDPKQYSTSIDDFRLTHSVRETKESLGVQIVSEHSKRKS